jgi:DNA repair protein RadC
VFKIFTYTQGLADEASIEADEFGKILSRYHPYAMFVAHNHVQTGSRPSRSDNRFTKQCQLVCSVYHVQFYDHVVVGGDGTTYSFNNQKHIERIQKDFSLEAVLSHQPEPEF